MKKFDLVVGGNEVFWKDEYGNPYGGFEPHTIGISVTGEELYDEEIDMGNVYFENIGYIDFDIDGVGDYTNGDSDYNAELEFTDEEDEESENYLDDEDEIEEGKSELLYYIEACIGIRYGEVRLNGIPTGIEVTKEIYFNNRVIDLEE